jgi:gluconate kinase
MSNRFDIPLDLTKAPCTLFFFGLSGCGKSFVGEVIADLADWHVYHADDDLTAEMQQALAQHQAFTEPMRDRFFEIIAEKIIQLQLTHKQLVITQAVYKQKHREFLQSKIPNMEMIMVDCDDQLILERIQHRSEGISRQSAAALRQDFELPKSDVKIVINSSDRQNIVRQLNDLFAG